jgi:hypothetical protein
MLYRPGQQNRPGQPGGLGGPSAHIDQLITSPAPLPFPTEARLDSTGEPVTLMQTCDWKGQSPANIGVDRLGKQFLATFDELTVTDHRVLPNPAVDAIRTGRPEASAR